MEWDRQKIQQLFPNEEAKILTIKPSSSGAPDRRIWLSSDTGEYTTKTGTNLAARNIPVDPRCKRCGEPESSYHLLFQCSYTHQVWSLASYMRSVEASGLLDLEQEWRNTCNITTLPPGGNPITPAHSFDLLAPMDSKKQLVKESKTNRSLPRPEENVERIALLQTDAAWNSDTLNAGLGWVVKMESATSTAPSFSTFVGSPLVVEGMTVRVPLQRCRDIKAEM
ncbi:hypothetical protein F2Q68_00008589 [Brassica cretica]|uniref:Reverse transcriptase zinc-binding domain-containing protein n=1 Tax=Brassica cretica TaxID=69181 RepID=A0A8S9KYM4_BRACR|nr:hypothetical protein F2Q68_00008589 [Brassica cretica]